MRNKKQISQLLMFQVWKSLSKKRHTQIYLLFLLMFASALSEVVSLSCVIPFLAVISNPEGFYEKGFISEIGTYIGISSAKELIFPITFLFVFLAILSASLRLINIWFYCRLAAAIGSDLSCKVYSNILHQPYEFHLKNNSSSIINVNIRHINDTVTAIKLSLEFITSAIISISIFSTIIWIDGRIAFIAALVFGGSYFIIALKIKAKLAKNSFQVAERSKYQLKALQEGLGAIREVMLDCSQDTYMKIYRKSDVPLRETEANTSFLSIVPRFSLEAIGITLISTITTFLYWKNGNISYILPILGTIALGSQRLLPALQQMYSAWVGINGCSTGIKEVINMLSMHPEYVKISNPINNFNLNKIIEVKDLSYKYNSKSKIILNNLHLTISKGEKLGIIGRTGSGKSTLIDIIIGLLKPSSGKILIDDVDIYKKENSNMLFNWRSSISHVPQCIYLSDSTLEENIAFGIPKEDIDTEKVKLSAKKALINEFIESLPRKYQTTVGERGVRLSGGQRQRIAIARAFYKDTKILILDEATSALDNLTETKLMESLSKQIDDLTLIIVAHRLTTLSVCDRIIEVTNGNIIYKNI